MTNVDAKQLKGLVFKGAKPVIVEVDGQNKTVYEPFQRDLTPDDVLNSREDGNTIIICTADGKKYTLPQTATK